MTLAAGLTVLKRYKRLATGVTTLAKAGRAMLFSSCYLGEQVSRLYFCEDVGVCVRSHSGHLRVLVGYRSDLSLRGSLWLGGGRWFAPIASVFSGEWRVGSLEPHSPFAAGYYCVMVMARLTVCD